MERLLEVDPDYPYLLDWIARAHTGVHRRVAHSGKEGCDDRGGGCGEVVVGDGGDDQLQGQLDDAYSVLRLSCDFTVDELKASFRQRSLQAHPDKPTGDQAIFTQIADAYAVLSDRDTRWLYDVGGEDLFSELEAKLYPERQPYWPYYPTLLYHLLACSCPHYPGCI